MAATTIAVLNQKGGVGKTTTVINTAAYFAKKGKRVLVVDSDPQGNATSGLAIDKRQLSQSLYEMLVDPSASITDAIVSSKMENLDVLPANETLAAAEVDLVQTLEREKQLSRVLDNVSYDAALIDCPPSLGLLTINALTAADYVVIPVQAEYYALEGLGQLLDIVQRVRSGLNPRLELLGVVITMHDKRTMLSGQVKQELVKHFGDKLLRTEIPRNIRLAEAPSYGVSIFEHDKWSKGARAYKLVAEDLMGRLS